MIQQMTNRQLAQEINARIGNAPIPFDSVYSIALQIYQELGGEENDFDSVYSILLGILPLAESVAKKTSITDIDELPEPKDNNNIYRLNSDDEVYVSKHVSTEYTNRLPDEQQIDKAFLWESDKDFYYYKGAWKIKSIYDETELNGYGWLETIGDDWYLVITQYDVVHATVYTKCFAYNSFEEYHYEVDVDFENQIVNIGLDYNYLQWELAQTLQDYGITAVVPAIYNAPESACIGNATLVDTANGENAVYTGEVITVLDAQGENYITGYKWDDLVDSNYCYLTIKRASEIYYYYDNNDSIAYANTRLYYVDISSENPEEWFVNDASDFQNLYIPQLNAPDSEQVGKAYISDEYYYYKGEFNMQCSDGNITLYWWSTGNDITEMTANYITKIPANRVYGENNKVQHAYGDDFAFSQLQEQAIIYDGTLADFEDEWDSNVVIFPVYNLVKHTRVIENWEWQESATKKYVDNAIDNIPAYTAGDNISIVDNEISCTYEIGYGLQNNNQTIKLDDDVIKAISNCVHVTYDTLSDAEQYLTFEAMENNCVISVVKNYMNSPLTLEVSKDLVVWTTTNIPAKGVASINLGTINTGEKLYVRGDNATLSEALFSNHYYHLSTSKNAYVYGNVYSLLNSKTFSNITTLSDGCYLCDLFRLNEKIYSHISHKLVLPATTLTSGCYGYMFNCCTNLTVAPELPATTLSTACYYGMFNNCRNLNYIKCLATDISATSCLIEWVKNTAATGTFVKDANTTYPTGDSGIPSGWTIQNA